MNSSIAGIINRLLAPLHELACPRSTWKKLIVELRERGLGKSRESGAFLIGERRGGRARITDFILYDDLDPDCLKSGIVRFDGSYFGTLWDICKERNLTVVADVHVHPRGVGQSDSDRAYPMISRAGHIALILGHFAAGSNTASEIGIYRYLGKKQWSAVNGRSRKKYFCIGV